MTGCMNSYRTHQYRGPTGLSFSLGEGVEKPKGGPGRDRKEHLRRMVTI